MVLSPGARLGPYEIQSALGAGGMGEVYKARDTRLDRTVAIKVLPAQLAADPQFRDRFDREAKAIAALTHPHICSLYDVGHQNATHFLVMEYLEGQTLADRLNKGALPIDQVLGYAIEIADALDTAHRAGIVHRDLKPGNIMLTKSGAKLLDFGLAKTTAPIGAAAGLSMLPTTPAGLTAQGTILGTFQYMAPEQLEGREADTRTDIFAFGAVVYEMLTGKKAFEGRSHASLIAAILEREPPAMSSLQPMTSPALDRAVKRCLAKDLDNRWQDARDLSQELKWISESGSQTAVPAAATVRHAHLLRRSALASLTLSIVAAIAGFAVWNLKPSAAAPVIRSVFSLPPGDQLALAGLVPRVVALSSDGKQMVYTASRGNVQQLFHRSMDSFEARPIPGTEGANAPFFSPDSRWVGFFAERKLKKASIAGGSAVTLADVPTQVFSATWGSDDTIVYISTALMGGGLVRVSAAGGTPQPLTKGDLFARGLAFLPGAKALLFTAVAGAEGGRPVKVYDLKTGGQRVLVQDGVSAYYTPTGHLLYVQGGTLMAVPFDLGRMEVAGAAVPVVERVMQSVTEAQYSISDNGSLVYVPGNFQGAQTTMVWVDRKGVEQPVGAPASPLYGNLEISSEGRRVTVGHQGQVWIYDLARGTLSRLTSGAPSLNPGWTPDGKRVTFSSGTPVNVFWQPADGSGKAERLATSEHRLAPSGWSPDGQLLAFIETHPTTAQDIWILRLSDRKAEPFLRTPSNEGAPSFSPDGHWLVYSSDESGRWEIYVTPYPGPGGKSQISTDGGREPLWNRNGRELFYRNGNRMIAVDVTTQPTFSAGKAKTLFEGQYRTTNASLPTYDVGLDGQRFLMTKQSEQGTSVTQINVVLNWFEELKRRVPTK